MVLPIEGMPRIHAALEVSSIVDLRIDRDWEGVKVCEKEDSAVSKGKVGYIVDK